VAFFMGSVILNSLLNTVTEGFGSYEE